MAPQNQQPVNVNSMLLTKFDALTTTLDRLNDFLEAQYKRESKIAREPATIRAQQDEDMALFDDRLRPTYNKPAKVKRGGRVRNPLPGEEPLFQTDAQEIVDQRLPPDSNDRQSRQDLLKDYRDRVGQGNSRFRAMLGSLKARHTPQSDTPDPNVNSSLPPGLGGVGGPFGNNTNRQSADMISWAILGEHGGPAFIRNMALEQYGLSRSIDWAQKSANMLSTKYEDNPILKAIPGVNKESLGALSGAMQVAQDHPYATFAAYKGLQMMGHAMSQTSSNLQGYQALGQQLGYGPPSAFGQAIFGHRNPLGNFSTAAQTGAAYSMEQQALMGRIPGAGFGNGLTKEQAADTMGTLGGQGFGMQPVNPAITTLSAIPVLGGPLSKFLSIFDKPHGDAAMIGDHFFRPLMERFPGLKGQDLGQFTGSLRMGGTSIQQLTDQLSNLGVEARAAKETVGEFASSVADTSKQFESLGSSSQGGVAIGTGFTNVTGKDPQFAGMLGQNPLVQGLAMSRYGILPSGLGDMNSGAFTNNSMAAMQMMQKALGGLNQNKYAMVNGHQVLVQSGQQAVYDQIAHMMGVPSNLVKSMLHDQPGIQARSHAQTMLGDPTTGTGFYQYLSQHKGKLSDKDYKHADQVWKDTVSNTWQHTGISPEEMKRINHIKGLRDRAKRYAGDLANAAKDDKANQIYNTPNDRTVQVQFTGLAAKFFQQTGLSASKQQANAGQMLYNGVANSITGDSASPPPFK